MRPSLQSSCHARRCRVASSVRVFLRSDSLARSEAKCHSTRSPRGTRSPRDASVFASRCVALPVISMIEKQLRFALKLCALGLSVATLARAEQGRGLKLWRSHGDLSGGQRKIASGQAAVPARRALALPTFIAWQPGSQPPPGTPSPAKHASLSGVGLDCATHCVERRGLERGQSVTSAVLAGVASAGLATGFVLVLATPERSERASLVPSFRLRVSSERAVASARWRF